MLSFRIQTVTLGTNRLGTSETEMVEKKVTLD